MKRETIRSRFAVMNNAYAEYSFSYFLDSMDKLGLCKIDLWGGIQHFDPYEADDKKIQTLRATLAQRNFEIVAYTPEILGYPYNFASPYREIRSISVEYAKKNIRIAAALGVPVMLISPGWGLWDLPYQVSFEYALDSLAQITKEAEHCGVRLALEHLTVQSSNLLTSVKRVEKFVKTINSPQFGVALDLGQMSVFGEDIDQYFDCFGTKIYIIHMMDGSPASHLAFGDGVFPLSNYYYTLARCGYEGIITLEINDKKYCKAPHEALARCVEELEGWKDWEEH